MKLSNSQKAMLKDLDERCRFYDYIDLRTFNSLHAKGLVTTYTPPGCTGMDTTCHLTHAGKELFRVHQQQRET